MSKSRRTGATERDERAIRLLLRIATTLAIDADAAEARACPAGVARFQLENGLGLGGSLPIRELAKHHDGLARSVARAAAARLWTTRKRKR